MASLARARPISILVGLLATLSTPETRASVILDSGAELASGVPWVNGVALSPDGADLYVTSLGPPSVGHLRWNAGTEKLTAAQSYGFFLQSGDDAVVSSPDGKSVYVTGSGSTACALQAWARDPGTGALSFIASYPCGSVDVPAAISPDGLNLYVSATPANQLTVRSRDPMTGSLAVVETETNSALAGLVGLAVSPDGAHVYAVAGGSDALVVFSRSPANGELTHVETLLNGVAGVSGLQFPSSIAVSPDGAFVYVSNESEPGIGVFSRNPSTGSLTFVQTASGTGTSIFFRPDGAFAYVTGAILRAYARDAVTGALSPVDTEAVVLRGGVVSPDGATLFGAGGGTFAYGLDTATGAILGPLHELVGVVDMGAAEWGPGGDHLYVVGGQDGSIGVFERDPATGDLELIGGELEGFGNGLTDKFPIALALSPDGANVYVAANFTDELIVLARDVSSGLVQFVEIEKDGVAGVTGLDGIRAVRVSPDGEHVYAIGLHADSVAVFDRDAGSGVLTFLEAYEDGVGGVDGLDFPHDLLLSPDGAFVYVSSAGDGTLTLFARNAATGALTFVEALEREAGAPGAIAFGPGAAHLYSLDGAAVEVHERDAATGTLRHLQTTLHDENGIFGSSAPRALSVDPDGRSLYLQGEHGYGLVVSLRRDPASGRVYFVDWFTISNAGPETQQGFITTSPDGEHVYFGGRTLHRLEASFGCSEEPMTGCRTGGKSSLSIRRDPLRAARNQLQWSFTKGEPTPPEDFDTGLTNHFATCVYDESGITPVRVFDALAPAGQKCGNMDCWRSATKNEIYVDPILSPDGVRGMQLWHSTQAKTRITVSASGEPLSPPVLPLGLPLRVQVQSAEGLCWEAAYGAAQKNDAGRFKAKSP